MVHHFLASEIQNAAKDKAKFHIIPVPYEASVSYGGGTRRGPDAILEASDQLEIYDEWLDNNPHLLGIHTQEAVDCSAKNPETVMDNIAAAVTDSIKNNAIPCLLGGEHTVTYGAIKAFAAARGGDFGIVQFDAHADLRDSYEGSKYSHASVMKRCLDLGVPVFGIGIRAFCKEEAALRKKAGLASLDALTIADGVDLKQDILPASFPTNIYVTFDVDGLDPAVIRATGTPVPGGLSWNQAMAMLLNIKKGRNIIGVDVNELAPDKNDNASTFAAALLTWRLLSLAIS